MEYKATELKGFCDKRDKVYEEYKALCGHIDGIQGSLAYKLTDLINDKQLKGVAKVIACDKTPDCRAKLVFKGTMIPEETMTHLTDNYKVKGVEVKNRMTTIVLDE